MFILYFEIILLRALKYVQLTRYPNLNNKIHFNLIKCQFNLEYYKKAFPSIHKKYVTMNERAQHLPDYCL